ncbi:peptidase inhibitor family I36 protein [Streptomyces sp. NPDC056528]|uniref:peptidase inhibitor family I36 protein n=1 Tax=Streptomyces sp. NPDC056528 TaxID=3345854 RepID=UPI0036753B3C
MRDLYTKRLPMRRPLTKRTPARRPLTKRHAKRFLTTAVLAVLLLTALPVTAAPAAVTGTASGPKLGACGPGKLCLWPRPDFKGGVRTHELATTDVDSCVPLPAGTSAQSLANRTGRPVTTYQSAECAETGEFETYPGKGTWVPQSPHEVRAFKIWER